MLMSDSMSSHVTHVNASKPVNNHQQDYSNLYLLLHAPGNKYPWTSSPNFPEPRQDMMQLLFLLTHSQRWFTLCPPKLLPLPQTPPNCSSITSSSYMAFPNPLSPTEMPNSPVDFGNPYSTP